MRTLVLGDVHGAALALEQVLDRCKFDNENDKLIFLGDVADGWHETPKCVDIFMGIKNFVWCKGNHDAWVQKWITGQMKMAGVEQFIAYIEGKRFSGGMADPEAESWLQNGGVNTYKAYIEDPKAILRQEKFWEEKPVLYHVENNKCFVHAGFDRSLPIELQSKIMPHTLMWTRDFWNKAMSAGKMRLVWKDDFEEAYIGHTTTQIWNHIEPMYAGGVWNVDTGAGWSGKLTIMDVETKEFWQSDFSKELYPGYTGR